MNLTHDFEAAAKFSTEFAAFAAAELACAEADYAFCPVKESGAWVVQAQDWHDGASYGFLPTIDGEGRYQGQMFTPESARARKGGTFGT